MKLSRLILFSFMAFVFLVCAKQNQPQEEFSQKQQGIDTTITVTYDRFTKSKTVTTGNLALNSSLSMRLFVIGPTPRPESMMHYSLAFNSSSELAGTEVIFLGDGKRILPWNTPKIVSKEIWCSLLPEDVDKLLKAKVIEARIDGIEVVLGDEVKATIKRFVKRFKEENR